MKMHTNRIALVLLYLFLSTPIACAHTPFGSNNENNTIESAIEFSDPTKSWTMYRELHEAQEVEYYRLHPKPGEKFQFNVSTPRCVDPTFIPNAFAMWPGIADKNNVPNFVEVPVGYNASVINGARPSSPEYKAFTPASLLLRC